ncbi:S1C family serine protease [Halococcus hamelinensis]|uniref:S1C family serine protease n=1 Tax=Halococcus hamelinensis TaxID=332168 RepID=UPI00029B41E4|nr:trypsin-like peptidase domain-containing protein [Halococcus hamelinensis]
MSEGPSRREYLGGVGAVLAAGLAGCSNALGDTEGTATGNETTANATPTTNTTTNATRSADGTPSPYTRVYRNTIQSVVLIDATTPAGPATGSGFVYRNGYVVTNEHVVSEASSVRVRFAEGGWRSASVVGTDVSSDLAVLEVTNKPGYATALPLVEEQPPIGTEVVAIGNPYGRFDGSASTGIVSGVNRSIPAQNGYTIPDAVQTDAAVNPGNSGGPLMDLDSRVVGVINSGGGENIAFAISAALVERVVPALIEDGTYAHAYLGVASATMTPSLAEANGLDRTRGVYVDAVSRDGPAAGVLRGTQDRRRVEGGAVPTGGDVIVGVGGTGIDTRQELSSYLALNASPGETVPVTVRRNGNRRTLDVTLGERPEREGAGVAAGEPTTPGGTPTG